MKNGIEWLVDTRVITECNCLIFPELPLKGNIDESKYKLYYPDTGLLIAALDEEAQEDLRVNKNLGVYKGALYENFVAEAFVKQGLGLFYYKKDTQIIGIFLDTNNEVCLNPDPVHDIEGTKFLTKDSGYLHRRGI